MKPFLSAVLLLTPAAAGAYGRTAVSELRDCHVALSAGAEPAPERFDAPARDGHFYRLSASGEPAAWSCAALPGGRETCAPLDPAADDSSELEAAFREQLMGAADYVFTAAPECEPALRRGGWTGPSVAAPPPPVPAPAPADEGGMDAGAPVRRVEEMIRRETGAELPDAPPPAPAPARAASTVSGSAVYPAGLWESLRPLDAAGAGLAPRLSGVDLSEARELTAADADRLLAAAVERGHSTLDFFTDAMFRQSGQVYYIRGATIVEMGRRYQLNLLTPISGVTTGGRAQSFSMEALVIGAGRIDVLYQGERTFQNPDYGGRKFTVAARVTQRIMGDGDVTAEGIRAYDDMGIFWAWIRRVQRRPSNRVLITLSDPGGARLETLQLIRRR